MTSEPQFVISEENRKIAYHYHKGNDVSVVFCGGYMSDMEGTKAIYLENTCVKLGLSYLRFDYSGHGSSSEDFIDGTIGKWTEDALAVIDQVTKGPLLIIGSSMGGWIGLLICLARKDRLKAFIGIAPAPDFTRELMWDQYSQNIKDILKKDGVYLEPSEYSDEPYKVSYNFITEGEDHILLNGPIEINCPVRLFHGLKDTSVPSEFSARIAAKVVSEDVIISYNKSGDHRLSTVENLSRLKLALIELF